MNSSASGVTWNLSDLYTSPSDPAIQQDLTWLEVACKAFSDAYRPLFNQSGRLTAASLYEAVEQLEQIHQVLSKLSSYAGLLTAADTANDEYRRLEDRLRTVLVERENQLTFVLGWLAVSDDRAKQLINEPRLAGYRHDPSAVRRYRAYTLSEPEELLV